jgi:hypothetical protein
MGGPMTESRVTVVMWNAQQGYQQLLHLWGWLKAMLIAGHRIVVDARLETRSDAQNRLLHSRIGDVAKQLKWGGETLPMDDWKRLLTAAWCRTRNEGVRIVPALDGQGFDVLYQRTSKLSRAECADLSEYIMAWGSERGVEWRATSLGREAIDPETGEITQGATA